MFNKMSVYKKNILISLIAVAIIGSMYVYEEFNREQEDLYDKKPAQTVTSEDIIRAYDSNETSANEIFLSKIISVTGTIAEINNQADTLIYVLIGAGNDIHRVSCLLDKLQAPKIKQYDVGKQISVKGICTGYLMDVELNHCVIVSENEKLNK
jgi:hypothetical protein